MKPMIDRMLLFGAFMTMMFVVWVRWVSCLLAVPLAEGERALFYIPARSKIFRGRALGLFLSN